MMRLAGMLVLLAAAVFLLSVALKRPSSNFAVLSGGCLGLLAFVHPAALALTLLIAAPLFDRRYPMRARLHLAGSALLGLGSVLLVGALSRA
jgi:uncharacterized protein YybS (DUF2232 family)